MSRLFRGLDGLFRPMRRGALRFQKWFWDLLYRMPPRAPLALFYSVSPPLFVYLYLTENERFGVHYFSDTTGLAWWIIPATFALCGFFVNQAKSFYAYAMFVLPILLYAVFVAIGVMQNRIIAVDGLAALYLTYGCLAALGNIRQAYEAALIEQKLVMTEEKLRALEKRVEPGTAGH
jgi:hypothetical protein